MLGFVLVYLAVGFRGAVIRVDPVAPAQRTRSGSPDLVCRQPVGRRSRRRAPAGVRVRLRGFAYIYYGAVRAFGGPFYDSPEVATRIGTPMA